MASYVFSAVAVILLLHVVWSYAKLTPRVKLNDGFVRGSVLTSRKNRQFFAFRGIPFGESPTGELRFRIPVPKKPWRTTLLTVNDGAMCPQLKDNIVVGDEDCLYLNVYTPRIPRKNTRPLPVLVYISGGGFIKGDGRSDQWGPEYMLDKDFVLVTFNYRIGALGFLSTGDYVAPGNYELEDQLLVLQWVQRNIRKFGGDPKTVTLAGHSAGATCVNLHALSRKSKGLFHRYIMMSGNALYAWAFHKNSSYPSVAKRVAEVNQCPTDSSSSIVNCLRQVSVSQLVKATSVFNDPYLVDWETWSPVNSTNSADAFLTEDPHDAIEQHGVLDVPFMTGIVTNEGLLRTLELIADETEYNFFVANLDESIKAFLEFHVLPHKAATLVEAVKAFYFPDSKTADKKMLLQEISDFISDCLYAYPEHKILESHLRYGKSSSYQYSFEYRGTFSRTTQVLDNNDNYGTAHADELTYLFKLNQSVFRQPELNLNADDEEMIDLMVDLWTSFVITGVPTSEHMEDPFAWKPYSQERNCLRIGNNKTITTVPIQNSLKDRLNFWKSILES